MHLPSVSVIIPTFNAGPFIVQAVESALFQTVPPAEVIVVDDGSSDDTSRQLSFYEGRIRYLFQKNQGVSAALNQGIREANGQVIAFLGADDVWHPRKLEIQLEAFAANPDCGLIGTTHFPWPTTSIPVVNSHGPLRLQDVTWEQLVVRNCLTASSVMVLRDVLASAGPFDTRIQGAEDHDLWIRIIKVARVANIDLPLTGYRSVAGSLSKNPQLLRRNWQIILSKLDDCLQFNRRRLLRRKACGYFSLMCSKVDAFNGDYGAAVGMVLRSFAEYPFPFSRNEVTYTCARPRSLIVNVLRMLHLKSGELAARSASYGMNSGKAFAALRASVCPRNLEPVPSSF